MSKTNIGGVNSQDYEIDISNIPVELEGKYEINLENGTKVKGFSPEFLEKINKFGFSEKIISIISAGIQDRNGNITGGVHLEIGKIKGVDGFTTTQVRKNLRIYPKIK